MRCHHQLSTRRAAAAVRRATPHRTTAVLSTAAAAFAVCAAVRRAPCAAAAAVLPLLFAVAAILPPFAAPRAHRHRHRHHPSPSPVCRTARPPSVTIHPSSFTAVRASDRRRPSRARAAVRRRPPRARARPTRLTPSITTVRLPSALLSPHCRAAAAPFYLLLCATTQLQRAFAALPAPCAPRRPPICCCRRICSLRRQSRLCAVLLRRRICRCAFALSLRDLRRCLAVLHLRCCAAVFVHCCRRRCRFAVPFAFAPYCCYLQRAVCAAVLPYLLCRRFICCCSCRRPLLLSPPLRYLHLLLLLLRPLPQHCAAVDLPAAVLLLQHLRRLRRILHRLFCRAFAFDCRICRYCHLPQLLLLLLLPYLLPSPLRRRRRRIAAPPFAAAFDRPICRLPFCICRRADAAAPFAVFGLRATRAVDAICQFASICCYLLRRLRRFAIYLFAALRICCRAFATTHIHLPCRARAVAPALAAVSCCCCAARLP